ncbi:MAG: alpha/beta hydrolase fold domain-containing protein [Deltaproteobacteria bacterium]|nr:alpha/beta hydrolase fold domain-containing protein [Deltaproteobacteria bacterium]
MAAALRGPSGALRHARHTLVDRAVGALFSLAGRLPERWCLALGRMLGVMAFLVAGALRRTGHGNLRRVFPGMPTLARSRLLLGVGRRLGEAAAWTFLVARGAVPLERLVVVPPEARAALGPAPRGTVLATGHLGPWELLGATLASLGHETLAVVRRTRNDALARRVTALRAALGFQELPRGPTVAVGCVRALRRGALVGLLGDQSSDPRSTLVPFLGSAAPTPVGPALLARRTGARLVVAWLERREGSGWTLRAQEVPVAARDEDTLVAINGLLSAAILRDPEGWVWFHDRWAAGAPPRRAARGARWALAAALATAALAFTHAPPGTLRCEEGRCVLVLRDVSVGPRPQHRVDRYLPWPGNSARTGAVVLVHGGGWDDPLQRKEDLGPEALRFARDLGVPAFSVDYRLGREGGRYPEAVRDVRCALSWLGAHAAELGLRRDRVVLFGGSAGAQLSLLAADRRAPPEEAPPGACGPGATAAVASAVVAVSSPSDLGYLWSHLLPASARDLRAALRAHLGRACEDSPSDSRSACTVASPVSRVQSLPPFLLVHSDGDHLVPMHQPQRLLDADRRTGEPRGRLFFVPDSARTSCRVRRSMHGNSPCLLDPAWAEILLFSSRYVL